MTEVFSEWRKYKGGGEGGLGRWREGGGAGTGGTGDRSSCSWTWGDTKHSQTFNSDS